MKRSEFLKKLGIGIGVAMVAPKVFAEDKMIYPKLDDGVTIDTDLLPIRESALDFARHYPKTYGECYKYCLGDEVCDWDGNKWIVVSVPILTSIPNNYKYVVRPIRDDVNFGHDMIVDTEVFGSCFKSTGASVLLRFND